jgi:hypothetical protein
MHEDGNILDVGLEGLVPAQDEGLGHFNPAAWSLS